MQIVTAVSIILTILGILTLGLGALFGYRRGAYKSLVSLGGVLVAAALALFTAKLVSHAAAGVLNSFSDELPKIIYGSDSPETLKSFVVELARAVSGVALFLVLFPVFAALIKIPVGIISRVLKKYPPLKGDKFIGLGVSFVSALVFLAVLFSPIAGVVKLADTSSKTLLSGKTEYHEKFNKDVGEIRDNYISPAASSPVLSFSGGLTGFIFNSLTSINVGGARSTLQDEAVPLFELYVSFVPLIEEEIEKYGEIQLTSLEAAPAIFSKTKIIPLVLGDFISSAASELDSKGSYMDVEKDEILFAEQLCDIFKNTGKGDIENDLTQMAKLFGVLNDHKAFELFLENAKTEDVLSREGLISGVVDVAYSYTRFRPLTAAFLNVAFDFTSESLGFSKSALEELKLSSKDLPDLLSGEIKTEAKRLEDAAVLIIKSSTSIDSGKDLAGSDLSSLGRALDIVAESSILHGKVNPLIEAFLRSDTVKGKNVFTENAIQKILRAEGSYENLLSSMTKTLTIAKSINDKTAPADEAIKWLADNMDSSSAEVVSSVITPDLLKDYGADSKNAENLSNTVSEYITSLSAAEGLTESQADAESKCINYAFAIAKTATESGSKTLFGGEIESSEELVETFMGSAVFSRTVEGLVFGESGNNYDPIGVASYVTQQDKAEMSNTLEKYTKDNYKSAEDKDAFSKKVVSLGSLFGLDVTSNLDDWTK